MLLGILAWRLALFAILYSNFIWAITIYMDLD